MRRNGTERQDGGTKPRMQGLTNRTPHEITVVQPCPECGTYRDGFGTAYGDGVRCADCGADLPADVVVPPDGRVIRMAEPETRCADPVGGVPVREIAGSGAGACDEAVIEASAGGTLLVLVPRMVLEALTAAAAVACAAAPDTGPESAVRDAAGRITGVRWLVRRTAQAAG